MSSVDFKVAVLNFKLGSNSHTNPDENENQLLNSLHCLHPTQMEKCRDQKIYGKTQVNDNDQVECSRSPIEIQVVFSYESLRIEHK